MAIKLSINNVVEVPIGNITSHSNLCSSTDNDYIPTISLHRGKLYTSSKYGWKKFAYSLEVPILPDNVATRYRKFSTLTEVLAGRSSPRGTYPCGYLYYPTIRSRAYFVASGNLIFHPQATKSVPFAEPLILLCVKTSRIFDIQSNTLSPDDVCLVVSNDLVNDEKHNRVYRNVKKYIEEASETIDVLFTNNIRNVCLKSPELKIPKVSTAMELIQYTRNINAELAEALTFKS